MTTSKTLEVLEFACHMAREAKNPARALPGMLEDLMKLARRHLKLMERECNVGDVKESTVDRLQKRITDLCAEIGPGFVPVFGGDPRGATVKLKVPSGRTNDWGAEGICVPGS